jgi:hypothetical protein
MSEQTAYPEGAVCCVDGCPLPPAGERPSTRPYVFEDAVGRPLYTIAAGEADEIVCAKHMQEETT